MQQGFKVLIAAAVLVNCANGLRTKRATDFDSDVSVFIAQGPYS